MVGEEIPPLFSLKRNTMTLYELKKKIDYILANNKEAEKWQVIYSTDDEGNAYYPVYYMPTKGYFFDGEFSTDPDKKPNAVCIN
jgi:hypothetical protein